jgi:hypothetical protein
MPRPIGWPTASKVIRLQAIADRWAQNDTFSIERRHLIRDDVFDSVQSAMRVTFCRFEEGSTKAEHTLEIARLPGWERP